jgi:hypothetical protein
MIEIFSKNKIGEKMAFIGSKHLFSLTRNAACLSEKLATLSPRRTSETKLGKSS